MSNLPETAATQNHALVTVAPSAQEVACRNGASPAPISGSELRRYWSFLKRSWWLVFASLLFFGLLATGYVLFWPASYISKGQIWVAGTYRVREGATYDEQGQNFLATQAELLESTKIASRVVARLKAPFRLVVPPDWENSDLPVKLRVVQVQKSGVLELRAKGRDPNLVRAFLDATMEEFIAFKREVRVAKAGLTYNSVSEQLTKQEAELQAEQGKLNTYMRDNNTAALEEQAKAAGAYLTQLLTEQSRLQMENQILAASLTQTETQRVTAIEPRPSRPTVAGPQGAPLESRSQLSEFQTARQELEKLRIARERLGRYLRPKHPKMTRLQEQMAQYEKLLDFYQQQSQVELQAAYQGVQLKLSKLQAAINEWEGKLNNASSRLAELQGLKANVERVQSLHGRLVALLQNVDIGRNLEQEQIEVLDPASAAKPGKLNALPALSVAMALGFGLGLLLVFIAERWDDRITCLDELGGRFNEWIIGQVPELGKVTNRGRLLVESGDSRHMFAESHRNIRSALFFANYSEPKPKTLLITSAIPDEGKSTVAANLARTMAFGGHRVLLVDADMRRGGLHKLFQASPEPGLADVLANGTDLGPAIVSTSVPNLFLLPRGQSTTQSGELFLGQSCDRLLAQARAEFDCVIVDSIPIFAADDTTTLAPKMDGVVFVIRSSYTGSHTARRALELLYERQAKVLGLVFNRADSSGRGYQYYKYSQYTDSHAS